MKFFRRWGGCSAQLLLLNAAIGCSRSSAPEYVKVSGKVVDAKDRPVPKVAIHLFPVENIERFKVGRNGVNCPTAIGQKDGTFTLTMSGGDIEGAPPGTYRVMLRSFSKEQQQT